MRSIYINFFILILFCVNVYGQTEKVWRVNFLNPAIELETPTGKFSTLSSAIGVGYGGAYPKTSRSDGGFLYSINPFIDVQHKWFYNLDKRKLKKLSIENNSGNFLSTRIFVRGNTITSNFDRTTNFDFAVGPTWGIQRKYGEKFHLLFDLGPVYYFDTDGKGSVFPLIFQINLGFDL